MMELRYMPASAEDVDAIYKMSKELIDRYEDTSSIDYEKVLAWVKRKINGSICEYTRVCRGENTVAYFRLSAEGDSAELDDFYVLPEYRGIGIGTKILNECVVSTRKSVFLYVFNDNSGAISLYEKFGFVKREAVSPTRSIMVRNG